MKRIAKKVCGIFCSLISSTIILSLFCLVYSYSGIHIKNNTLATDYKWQPNQFRSTMTEGQSWFRFDENGFNNINYDLNDIDVLLMGSSHMEAVQMAKDKNVGAILNSQLDLSVYNIGMSGHQIYNIVNNYNYAVDYYHPRYVIIETDTINLNENNMVKVVENQFERIPSYDSGIVYYAQKIPAIKNIYKQLQDWISASSSVSSTKEDKTQNYSETLKGFLSIISNYSVSNDITPIIFYHPLEQLTKEGNVEYLTDNNALKEFKTTCEDLGIVFLDMTNYFKELYANEHKLAHGFNNTHVGKGHLNEDGHRIIARELIKLINELEGE